MAQPTDEGERAHSQLAGIWGVMGLKLKRYTTPAEEEAQAQAQAAAEVAAEAEAVAEAEAAARGAAEAPITKGQVCAEFVRLLSQLRPKSKQAEVPTSGGAAGSSGSSGSSGSGALAALKRGWDPFEGALPEGFGKNKKQEQSPKDAAQKKKQKQKQTVDKSTDASLAPVSRMSRATSLPTKLGRDDVFRKRNRDGISMVAVKIVLGKNGVSDYKMAKSMERSQEYAVRENRSGIFLACVDAWRESQPQP